jgi:hypothetical protein
MADPPTVPPRRPPGLIGPHDPQLLHGGPGPDVPIACDDQPVTVDFSGTQPRGKTG